MESSSFSSSENSQPTLPTWMVNFLAGGIAGTTAKTAIAPLDRVKILFQIRSKHYPYEGIPRTLHKVVLQEGVKGLWRGNTATVARIFPYAAIQFMVFERIKQFHFDRSANNHVTPFQNLLGGSMAGVVSVTFTYPLDLIRVRMGIVVHKQNQGIAHFARDIMLKEGGVSGLYRGIAPTLAGIIPYAGVNFSVYETTKKYFVQDEANPSVVTKLSCGAFAGLCGQTVAYPLDVVRRQMQTMGVADGHGHRHASTMQALRTIVAHDGFLGLFRGLSINYVKAVPAVSISFSVYESAKAFLKTL